MCDIEEMLAKAASKHAIVQHLQALFVQSIKFRSHYENVGHFEGANLFLPQVMMIEK